MTEKKEKKEKPQPKPLDAEDFKKHINEIVDQLVLIESARDVIKEVQGYLKTEYGLASGLTRATAVAVFKRNKEELEEKNEAILSLVELCE
jgi:hypothetical protein